MGKPGRTVVVDGAPYHVSVRCTRDTLVFTVYPEGDKRSLFRVRVPWRGTDQALLSVMHRPALAERLIRRARALGWHKVLEIPAGRLLIAETLAADPLPPLPPPSQPPLG
ncbi:hypothetical protein [Dactylosporangium sp. CS-033363]|uniref:hypothetical protein n=1 Tax=Dactylosporangium sp. CS-033363 TaxID=3239935 RepID=UPI003D8C77AA